MKRLTMNDGHAMNMTELALNQVSVENGQVWYLEPPETERRIEDLIRTAAETLDAELDPELSDDDLGEILLDWLQYGETEPEGVLAILYRALWAMAEVRERLKLYEDICFSADGTELLSTWALQILREAREALRNDPLTEAELREMNGKPVYLDFGDGGEYVLVRLKENDVYFTHKNTICAPTKIAFECGGKVYRRKPEKTGYDR